MKKTLLSIVAVLMIAANVRAQKHGPWDIFVGPRVGFVLNDFTSVNGEFRPGMLVGVNAEVFFSKRISLNMGFNYAQQGCNNVQRPNLEEYDYDLAYINTEFTFRYYPVHRFCFFGGLNLGRVVTSRIKGPDGKYGLKDYMHRGSVSLPIGMAVNYKRCELGVSYSYQINKIARSSFSDYMGDARNTTIMASFVYRTQLF